MCDPCSRRCAVRSPLPGRGRRAGRGGRNGHRRRDAGAARARRRRPRRAIWRCRWRRSAATRRSRCSAARIAVRGIVTPYVAGQTVTVTFYLTGQKVGAEDRARARGRNGTGQFQIDYSSRFGGLAEIASQHAATPAAGSVQRALAGRALRLPTASARASKGQSVRLLQSELNALHYAVPLNGTFDEATGHAAPRISQDDRPRTGRARRAAGVRAVESAARARFTSAIPGTAGTSRPT